MLEKLYCNYKACKINRVQWIVHLVGQSRVRRYIHLGKYDVTSHIIFLDTTTEDSAPRIIPTRSITPVVAAVVVVVVVITTVIGVIIAVISAMIYRYKQNSKNLPIY